MEPLELRALFAAKSASDVVQSLFALASWNPNRSTWLRMLYAFCCTASIRENDFESERISTYDQFILFARELFAHLPEFPAVEDFMPQGDWGEIRFPLGNHQSHILYGSDLSWTYDQLTQFEMVFRKYRKQFENVCGADPIIHIENALALQDWIIKSLPNHSSENGAIGDLEIPPESFWRQCIANSLLVNSIGLSPSFVESFSVSLGDIESEEVTPQRFLQEFYFNPKLSFCFVKIGSKHLPTLPRYVTSALLQYWENISKRLGDQIKKIDVPIPIDVGLTVGSFVRERMKQSDVFLLVSVGELGKRPNDFVFPFAILSRHTLYLFAFISPFVSSSGFDERLQAISKELKKIATLFKSEWALTSHFNRVQLTIAKDKLGPPQTKFIVLSSGFSVTPRLIRMPKNFGAELWSLEQFLGIIDESDDADDLDDFFDFRGSIIDKIPPRTDLINIFCAYKDSYGVLVEGALSPDFIGLDPHWGNERRFQSLKNFWDAFPKVNYIGDPRSWEIHEVGPMRVRLLSRCNLSFAYAIPFQSASIFVGASFSSPEEQTILITDALMQCLTDSIIDHATTLSRHSIFETTDRLMIFFYPSSFLDKPEFSHLAHLNPGDEHWKVDCGMTVYGFVGIRVVFFPDAVCDVLERAVDRNLEVDIFQSAIRALNSHVDDPDIFNQLIDDSNSNRSSKPRYTLMRAKRKGSFPRYVDPFEPTTKHFKLARNIIADIAKKFHISPGKFQLTEAKEIINALVRGVFTIIENAISDFEYETSCRFLLTRTDALISRHEEISLQYEDTKGRQVEFDPAVRSSEETEKFRRAYQDYCFLIECFVLARPSGPRLLDRETFGLLSALAHWFFVFCGASDQIEFDISPTELEITESYLANVRYDSDVEKKMESYGAYKERKRIGGIGNPLDKIEARRPINDYLEEVDQAFLSDLGFGLRQLFNILQILSAWPEHTGNAERSCYEVEVQEITAVCLKHVTDLNDAQAINALQFATLKRQNLRRIIGRPTDSPILPVWEYYKRHSRYNIRPLLETRKGLLWGPMSTERTSRIWAGSPIIGKTPVNLESSRIEAVLSKHKRSVDQDLVKKAAEIARRFTSKVETNVQLHRRDKTFGHPPILGDYDLLAYLANESTMLNVECKHLLPAYNLKDTRDLREKIFENGEDGYLARFKRRDDHLRRNISRIFSALRWEVPATAPKILTVFVTVFSYWWTFSPPVETDIVFVEIDVFENFIKHELGQ